jgi:hypothetical protein
MKKPITLPLYVAGVYMIALHSLVSNPSVVRAEASRVDYGIDVVSLSKQVLEC